MIKPWNRKMRAEMPSLQYKTFLDHDGNEVDPSKYIVTVAYGNNFESSKIHHGNMLFVNPIFEDSDITNEKIVLDIDYVLWYVDRDNNKLYRKDGKEKEFSLREIKGYVKYCYNMYQELKIIE